MTGRAEEVGFESDRWKLVNGEITTRLGRDCLSGSAYLEDVDFANGVIEVDVAVNGSRSYPGIIFRVQAEGDYERFYIRPHRAGLYPDALQYTPVFNGIAGWQLYNGEGNYLVSHWEGQTYLVSPDGAVTEILDTMGEGVNNADFEFLRDRNLLIVPTFLDNRVVAYRLEAG